MDRTSGIRQVRIAGWVLWMFCAMVSTAHSQQQPRLAMMATDAGLPGGTVAVALELGNVLETDVVEVFADLRFDADILSLRFTDCFIAESIEASHALDGEAGSGNVQLSVLPEQGGAVLPPGALATCRFGIDAGVPLGTVTEISFADAQAIDPNDNVLEVLTLEGVVIIDESTPVPTSTPGPTFTVRSASAPGDCSVVAPDSANGAGSWLLVTGLLVLLVRRHRATATARDTPRR